MLNEWQKNEKKRKSNDSLTNENDNSLNQKQNGLNLDQNEDSNLKMSKIKIINTYDEYNDDNKISNLAIEFKIKLYSRFTINTQNK